ncbi:MAG: exodeoxyribonuclease VII large subunit, partial [Alphaproteobacteria bacterium]|nr:exodeoxyribonuclease VII large subunit [Alphaproteobacteria bacterium]
MAKQTAKSKSAKSTGTSSAQPTPAELPALDDNQNKDNVVAFSVSELAQSIKQAVEGRFGHVRVRGEIGRVTKASSGHIYLGLKDDKAVLEAVIWRGMAQQLAVPPQEGLEVICTGRITTYSPQSRYQLVIEH